MYVVCWLVSLHSLFIVIGHAVTKFHCDKAQILSLKTFITLFLATAEQS